MIKCPSCGFNNPDALDRCIKCKSALKTQAVPDGSHVADRAVPDMSPAYALRRAWYFLRGRLRWKLPEGVAHRFPWSAAYLSLLFGAGQLYNRQYGKAALFALIQVAFIAVFVYTIKMPVNDLVALGLFFWFLYVMADGFSVAARINGDYWRWRQVLAVWFALMFTFCSFVFLINLLGRGLMFTLTVKSPAMDPVIRKGDKLLVLGDGFSWMIGKGSVVFYDAPPITYEEPGALSTNIYSANERNSIGVVTATEGDVLSWAGDGPIRVNGTPVAANQLPINPLGMAFDLEQRIPEDNYGIIYTNRIVEQGLLSFLGGSYAGALPNPREAAQSGFIVKDYEDSMKIPGGDVYGIIIMCYYPPERRRWFGTSNGVWDDYPPGYQPR